MVVERCHDADIMQSAGIAQKILYGVCHGVEHIRRAEHHLRALRHTLHQVVIIGIDTGNHVLPRVLQYALESRPLASAKDILAVARLCRQHDFKVTLAVLKPAEDGTPESMSS